jgi:hypothetical protein
VAGTKTLSAPDNNGLKITNLADGTVSTDAATKGQLDTASTNDRSRANHTGSQTASTISDFDTQVRTSRIDQLAAPTGALGLNSQRITSLADPSGAQDAATRNYVDTQISGLTSGLILKGSVRAATSTNITIATPGATIDGLTAANGEVFLLMGQSTGSQNGPWTFNGSAAAMTRPANFDTSGEAVLGSFWDVREGTNADTFALMTNDAAVTLGTTALTFVIRGTAAAGSTGYTTTCPAVSAGATWTVTHNLATKYVVAQVARVASPYDFVDVRIERTTTNTLSILPDVSLASGEYEVLIQKVA